MNKVGIVFREVYRKNVLSWSFLGMVLYPVIMVIIVGLIGYFAGREAMDSGSEPIAIIGADSTIQHLLDEGDITNPLDYDMTLQEAQEALSDNNIQGYLTFHDGDIVPTYYRQTTSDNVNLSQFENILSQYQLDQIIEDLGLSQEELSQIQESNVTIEQVNISQTEDGQTEETSTTDPKVFIRTGVAYAISFIVFLFIVNYVSIISQEIAAEKGSRIMEIVLSSISPTQHFAGKILGIIGVILTQIIIYIMMYFLGSYLIQQFNLFTELQSFDIWGMISGAQDTIWIGVIYAITGIIIFIALAGFLGSLVSRTEDVNKMISPIMIMAVAGFYIGMFALSSPNSPLVRISSFIPFFTPFVMPFRVASDTVSNHEIIISVILSVIVSLLIMWISVVFYKSNVLTYSDKGLINTFKNSYLLWKSERATK